MAIFSILIIELVFYFLFLSGFFIFCSAAWHLWSQFPDQWSNLGTWQWRPGVLITGPAGNSFVSLLSIVHFVSRLAAHPGCLPVGSPCAVNQHHTLCGQDPAGLPSLLTSATAAALFLTPCAPPGPLNWTSAQGGEVFHKDLPLLLQEHRPGLAPSHSLCWGAPALPAWPKPLPGRAGLWSWVCKGLPALPPGMRARPLSSRPLGGSPPRGHVMRSPHAALSPGSPALALSACCSHSTHPGPCQPAVCAQSEDEAKPFQHQ